MNNVDAVPVVPATSKSAVGFVELIPTLPSEVTRSLSTLEVPVAKVNVPVLTLN